MTAVSRTSFGHFSITRLFTKFGLLCLFIFTLFTFNFPLSTSHAAQPPTIINYQGKLLNSSGQSVTSTVSISLVLFTAATDGTAVYTAGGTLSATSTISITPTNGIFTVSLGDGVLTNALSPDIFQNNQTLYLDVYVGGDHLSPRKQVSAVPYAYNAKYLDGVAATTTASSSTYIPISDSIGNFNFRHITSTDIFVSGTSTLATTTFTGTVTVTKELIAQAIKDALGWIPNQATPARLSTGFNNGGFGGGATPGNLNMTSTGVSFFDIGAATASGKGYTGAVYDGRYMYFVPSWENGAYLARLDTTASYAATSSWTFFNLASMSQNYKSYESAVFDGRYIYFVPFYNTNNSAYDDIVLRYDTTLSLTVSSSYAAYPTTSVNTNSKGFTSAAFDGRYVYFSTYSNGVAATGVITRYDTTGGFESSGSWTAYSVQTLNSNARGFAGSIFDGRYIYFVPHNNGVNSGWMARYDTAGTFSSDSSWTVVDLSQINGDAKAFFGGAFDGRYLYLAPHFSSAIPGRPFARYDTSQAIAASSSWSFWYASSTVGSNAGYHGAAYDGRYVYFAPLSSPNSSYHGNVVRFDSAAGSFSATSSWSYLNVAISNSSAKGYNSIALDGRSIYLVPYYNGSDYSGLVTRLTSWSGGTDTTNSISKIARSSDFFLDSSSKVGIGTNSPTKLLTIQGTVSSTTGISIGTGITTSSLDHERGLIIASTTANRLGLFNIEPVNGNVSASGTLRTFGGVTGMGISVSSTATTNTVFSYFTNNTVGNALVFDTNTTITSSTSALYSWRNNGLKLMSLSASGTLDVYGSISSMNASLGSPGTPGDLSERVDVKQSEFNELVPGDVLTVDLDSPDTYKKTTGNQTDPVMGVIATHPTLILGNGKTQYTKILTFLGRTNVKVSLKNGVIHPGDPLTNATDEPGKAMKQTDAGPTIGTALEPYYEYTEQNQGQILVLVRPGWSGGTSSFTKAATSEGGVVNAAVETVVSALRSLGIEIANGIMSVTKIVTERLTANQMKASVLCISDVCISKTDLQKMLEKNNASTSPVVEPTTEPTTEPIDIPVPPIVTPTTTLE